MGRYKKLAPCKGKIYVANLGRGLERIFKIAGLYTITVEKDLSLIHILNMLLTYYKLLDDWEDDRDYKALIMAGLLKRRCRKMCIRDSCCAAGWQITIDEESLERYEKMEGEIGVAGPVFFILIRHQVAGFGGCADKHRQHPCGHGIQGAAVANAPGLGPVSYTHLDVYKRQAMDKSARFFSIVPAHMSTWDAFLARWPISIICATSINLSV